MKKIRKLTLIFLLVAALAVTVSAAQYGNANDLFTQWETDGYPDFVAGVYSADGGADLAILIVEGGEAEAKALQDVTAAELTFVYGAKYSQNELNRINDEIVQEYMIGGDGKVVGCGTGWTVVNGEVTGFGESGKEFRVTVMVLDDAAQEYANVFYEKYGDAVVVEATDGIVTTDTAAVLEEVSLSLDLGASGTQRQWILLALFALVLLLLLCVLTLRRRTMQTAKKVASSKPVQPRKDFEDLKKRL